MINSIVLDDDLLYIGRQIIGEVKNTFCLHHKTLDNDNLYCRGLLFKENQ